MKRQYLLLFILIAALLGAAASYYLKQMDLSIPFTQSLLDARRAFTPTEMIGQPMPAFVLNNLQGESVASAQWAGDVLLINFWASWCPPCRREIPEFAEVREFYHDQGFEVIGIAIDNQADVEEFLQALPQVQYPQLIGDRDAVEFGSLLGNRNSSLPYSVLVDAAGIIRFVKYGELSKTTLLEQLEPLLADRSG